MARRRTGGVSTAGVPVELLDPAHSVWATEAATREWLSRHSLGWGSEYGMEWGPRSRLGIATLRWALAKGWTVLYGTTATPDLHRLTAAGAYHGGSLGGDAREQAAAMVSVPRIRAVDE